MTTGHERILVVDDEPAMLRTVSRILSPRYDVQGFSDGAQALASFRATPYDLAIIDVRMPGMDGFELMREIKKVNPRIEVILVTGSVTDLDEKLIRSIEERAFYLITKPFSRPVLTSLVGWSLEMQRLEEERDGLIRRLTEDLERARRYQQALLPRGLPRSFGPVRVASAYLSCEAVGGDLFDVVPLPDDRLMLMVADVAGHGVAAALLTGMVKTSLGRSFQEGLGLASTAKAVQETLLPLGPQRVVTLFIGIVDVGGRTLQYLNAGHPPALLWGSGRETRLLGATTPLLSYNLAIQEAPEATVAFGPGDRLGLYSDGLYEVLDPSGNEFGRDRLLRSMAAATGPIEAGVEALMRETREHAAGRPPADDLTLLMAAFEEEGGTALRPEPVRV
ncbi:MAG TPA: fused response regulator/phosphatase [Candidatus Polarisedimenticolia bacterium]|nr:fused response regulator/phosphatase [Candidatus Polarisedimenticolia bacterium]